jgi:protein-tyrosine phosphatase
MAEPTRLLFVCLGNICRSPSGENMMRHVLREESLLESFELDSAGTESWHIGKSPDSRMIEAARNRGIEMTGRARQVTPEDFKTFDWILAMDRSNFDDLIDVRERCHDPRARLVLFCEFCEEHRADEVPDPYYGGPEGFETVLDLLEDGCRSFLRRWRSHELPE